MIFRVKLNIKVFYKLVVSSLLIIARHAQSTQNNIFVISMQYLKKEDRDKVDFLHADKHQTILQVDTINPGAMTRSTQITKNSKLQNLCNTRFSYKKMSLKNPQNLKKMLRKSPAPNALAENFKNADLF